MRVVIIGASGHVGTYLVPRLVAAGYEVIAISRGQSSPYQQHAAWRSVTHISLDREREEAAGAFGPRVRDLVPVGAAGALAAAFNTPVAAVLFALEEIIGDLNAPLLGSTVVASVASVIVERSILGNEPLFRVPPSRLVHPAELFAYAYATPVPNEPRQFPGESPASED